MVHLKRSTDYSTPAHSSSSTRCRERLTQAGSQAPNTTKQYLWVETRWRTWRQAYLLIFEYFVTAGFPWNQTRLNFSSMFHIFFLRILSLTFRTSCPPPPPHSFNLSVYLPIFQAWFFCAQRKRKRKITNKTRILRGEHACLRHNWWTQGGTYMYVRLWDKIHRGYMAGDWESHTPQNTCKKKKRAGGCELKYRKNCLLSLQCWSATVDYSYQPKRAWARLKVSLTLFLFYLSLSILLPPGLNFNHFPRLPTSLSYVLSWHTETPSTRHFVPVGELLKIHLKVIKQRREPCSAMTIDLRGTKDVQHVSQCITAACWQSNFLLSMLVGAGMQHRMGPYLPLVGKANEPKSTPSTKWTPHRLPARGVVCGASCYIHVGNTRHHRGRIWVADLLVKN